MGPQIKTERLSLRLPELADAPLLSKHCGDLDVAKNTSRIPHPYPVLSAEIWVLTTRAAYRPGGNLMMTAEYEGQLAGGGGVFRRSPGSDWEIGYWLARPVWGRGLGTELGQALVSYAREKLGATRIIAGHYADNPASGRILQKLGFEYTGEEPHLFSMARMGRYPCKSMTLDGGAQTAA